MRKFIIILGLIVSSIILNGCAAYHDDAVTLPTPNFTKATNTNNTSVKVVREYVAVPLESQHMLLTKPDTHKIKSLSNITAINMANKKATQTPKEKNFINSVMHYNYLSGALYPVYSAPGQITDIEFAPGEQINSYGAGDTLRWELGKTYSGNNPVREHLLIKPKEPNLKTTLVVMTNQRVYHIQLKSTDSAFMSAVKWDYPNALVTQFVQTPIENSAKKSSDNNLANIDINNMNTNYKTATLSGDTKNWWPDLIFDDGKKTFIRFPTSVEVSNLPILMVDTGEQHYASAINYRVKGHYMVVDTLFDHAQLVMGDKHDHNRAVVEISRVS